jgi:hypothetical protein
MEGPSLKVRSGIRVGARLDGDDKAAGLAFSPDGATLAVDGEGRTTTLWDFAAVAAIVVDPAGYACAALGHGLTRAEWAVYAQGRRPCRTRHRRRLPHGRPGGP